MNPSSTPGQPANPATSLDSRGLPPGYLFKPDWEVAPRRAADELALGSSASAASNQCPPLDLAAKPFAKPLLLDCRRDDEFAFNRIPGAILIPLHELAQRACELEHDPGLEQAPGKDRPIFVYCHHGRRSLQAASILRTQGFLNAYSIAGGIDLWSIAVDPSIPRY